MLLLQIVGRVYHRGSGERHVVRLPSYPAFEGYSLEEFDSVDEGELSKLNRLVAEREQAMMGHEFHDKLLYNIGVAGVLKCLFPILPYNPVQFRDLQASSLSLFICLSWRRKAYVL